MTSRKHGRRTAADFLAELEQDPEYQRSRAKADTEHRARTDALTRAEQPIVKDLRKAGFDVDSVWDLVNTSSPYPEALPILIAHLERGGYPPRIFEGAARALAVRPASVYWYRLRALYLQATDRNETEGLAVALAAAAAPEHLDDLIAVLLDKTGSGYRGHFIGAVRRIGGERGREVIGALRDDPVLGKEATAELQRRQHR